MAARSPVLAVRVLGGFAVAIDGEVVPERAWGSRKAQALVKLLALAPGQRLGRDRIIEALWPESDAATGERNFHQALYTARRAIDPGRAGVLALRRQVVALLPPGVLAIDLLDFTGAAAAARRRRTPEAYAAALALYAGELLPDDRYEDWASAAREAARELRCALLGELAALHEAAGAWDAAVAAVEQIVAEEPAREEAHVALMRLHALAGRRQRALAQFGVLRAVLRRELDAEPDSEGQRLYGAILAGRFPEGGGGKEERGGGEEAGAGQGLPVPATSLIGREGEIARVRGALGEARLVTLVGAGGCGKTRLAVAVAAGLAGEYPGGIWLADLAPLAEGALVAGAVAQAVGVRERSGEPVLETLVGALRAGRRLLVLDNCEHLIEDAAALAATLLARCPELRVLATSRAALRAGGELVWRVPSLPVPEGEGLAAARESAAIRLFVERARYAQPGFALTAATVGAVTAICRRLDGIPLAIELAAARVGHLGVGQIADRLDDALRLLTGGGRTAPPRHRTLAATLDWSFALLTDAERRLLEEVAVFAGGFTLAAAEAVDGGAWGVDARRATSDAPGAAETLDTLAALVEQSLVQVWQGEGEPRYRLLETVRQFALARLVGRGGEAAARDRHAAYYRALVAEAERELVGPRQVWWLVELERELDNLRAALAWYRQGGRAEEGARLVTGLHRFWISQAHYREGRDWLAGLLREHGDRLPTPLRGRALSQLGGVNWLLGDLDAAVAQVGEALGIFRATGDRAGQGDAALRLGEIERYAGRAGVAEGYLAGALEAYRAVGDERSAAMARNSLANLLIDRGDFAAATAHYAEVVAIGRALGDAILLSMPLLNLGFVWMMRGDHARAREFLRESVATCERIRDWRTLHFNLIALALLANAEGRPADAARLLGATAAVSALTGVPLQHAERDYHDRAVAAAREALGVAGYDAACAEGRGWSVAEAIGRALAQCAGG